MLSFGELSRDNRQGSAPQLIITCTKRAISDANPHFSTLDPFVGSGPKQLNSFFRNFYDNCYILVQAPKATDRDTIYLNCTKSLVPFYIVRYYISKNNNDHNA